MSKTGLIHIYYGTGKGKSTAALGLALRAAGSGKNVVVAQFLKSWTCGEHNSLPHLPNITLLRGKAANGKFVYVMSDEEKLETKASQEECLISAIELAENGACDVLIQDEAIDAHEMGVLDLDILEKIIYNKPDMLELIITGHNPNEKLLAQADYITEMKNHKHPYDKGISARKGIEY